MHVYLTLVKGINLVLVPSFPQFFHILLDFFQIEDTNLDKYINLFGWILRMLNIKHIPNAMSYAVVCGYVLIRLYLDKVGLLII